MQGYEACGLLGCLKVWRLRLQNVVTTKDEDDDHFFFSSVLTKSPDFEIFTWSFGFSFVHSKHSIAHKMCMPSITLPNTTF